MVWYDQLVYLRTKKDSRGKTWILATALRLVHNNYDARVHACIALRWVCVTWGQLGVVVRVLDSRSLGLTVQYQVHVPVWGGVSLILAFMARWITPVHPCTELDREKNTEKNSQVFITRHKNAMQRNTRIGSEVWSLCLHCSERQHKGNATGTLVLYCEPALIVRMTSNSVVYT